VYFNKTYVGIYKATGWKTEITYVDSR